MADLCGGIVTHSLGNSDPVTGTWVVAFLNCISVLRVSDKQSQRRIKRVDNESPGSIQMLAHGAKACFDIANIRISPSAH